MFTFVTGKLIVKPTFATMISPTPGSVLGNTQTFVWATGGATQTYSILISAIAAGAFDVFHPGYQTTTSATATNLPSSGRTLYVRLVTYVNGAPQYVDYTYIAAAPSKAALTLPTTGPLSGTVTFQWNAGKGVSTYGLYVSAVAPGRNEIFSAMGLTTLQQTVSNIPSGKTIYVRLWSTINGAGQYTDYTF